MQIEDAVKTLKLVLDEIDNQGITADIASLLSRFCTDLQDCGFTTSESIDIMKCLIAQVKT